MWKPSLPHRSRDAGFGAPDWRGTDETAAEAQERSAGMGAGRQWKHAPMTPRCARNALLVALILLGLLRHLSASPNLRGVARGDEAYFRSETFECKDGSKTLSRERLNDDFCDCTDGTDEPGTNACPEAKFHCSNSESWPAVLFSSAVNDGICDCCDGSDEFDGRRQCPNSCAESVSNSHSVVEERGDASTEDLLSRKVDFGLAVEREFELKRLRREKTDLKHVVVSLKDLKVVLLLEMVAVAALCWWQFSAAKWLFGRRWPARRL